MNKKIENTKEANNEKIEPLKTSKTEKVSNYKKKKKVKRNITSGIAYVYSSFNNTLFL